MTNAQHKAMERVLRDDPHPKELAWVLSAENGPELFSRHKQVAATYGKSEYETVCLWLYVVKDMEDRAFRYGQVAHMYEQMTMDTGLIDAVKLAADHMMKYVPTSARIIDIAAGTGTVGTQLHKRGYRHVEALDISDGMLEVARKKNVYTTFHKQVLGQSWDLPSGSFDAATCVNALPDDPTAIPVEVVFDEPIRVIKSGGHIVFTLLDGVAERYGYIDKLAELETAGKWQRVVATDALPAGTDFKRPLTPRLYVYRII